MWKEVNRSRLKSNKKNIPELMVRYGCTILYLGIGVSCSDWCMCIYEGEGGSEIEK